MNIARLEEIPMFPSRLLERFLGSPNNTGRKFQAL